ncbi:MAG: alpha/beta hydrolase [Verrucomicrobiales bacterium]|nr:alpha/beta hydrolase [Verrucomicrobiales bacterium]
MKKNINVPVPSHWESLISGGGVIWLALVLFLPACTTVKVSTKPQRVTDEGILSANRLKKIALQTPSQDDDKTYAGFSKQTVDLLKRAKKLDSRGANVDAAEHFLEVAIEARKLLVDLVEPSKSPAQKALFTVHNAALARFAEFWTLDPRRQQPGPYLFDFEDHTFEIVMDKNTDYKRHFFDGAVAARSIKGRGVLKKVREGYGAAMVGIREQRSGREQEMRFFSKRGMYVAGTLVMGDPYHAKGKDAPIVVPLSIKNPALHETVKVGGYTVPLAADFSAPFELLLDGSKELLEGLTGFFKADQRAATSGVFLLEPYDPDRIPVILVHGLVSVPMIWRSMIPDLLSDPEIAKRYQFMVFTYPSSYSIGESALLFRENLAALRAKYDPEGNHALSKDTVLIGHSMGGVLSHLMTADFGDRIWDQVSDVPLEQTKFSPQAKKKLRELAFFEPDPAVNRVIYIAAPHRGAKLALTNLPNLLSNLVKLPGNVLSTTTSFLAEPALRDLKIPMSKKLTSIQSLRPDAPITLAMDKAPYRKGVVYHSIIGDKGKGDSPESSDGVVEYWSSHQEGAASEIIVPTGHGGSYKHPKASAEIKRILHLHAGIK